MQSMFFEAEITATQLSSVETKFTDLQTTGFGKYLSRKKYVGRRRSRWSGYLVWKLYVVRFTAYAHWCFASLVLPEKKYHVLCVHVNVHVHSHAILNAVRATSCRYVHNNNQSIMHIITNSSSWWAKITCILGWADPKILETRCFFQIISHIWSAKAVYIDWECSPKPAP